MKCNHKTIKNVVKKTLTALLLFFIISSSIHTLFSRNVIIISKASSENIAWNATIRVTESGGRGDDVVFGEALDASDDQDEYDKIKPPFPPQFPFILARFDTNLESPYHELWYEYKQYPDDYKIWNLSIMWMPDPSDESLTTIDILWDKDKVDDSEYDSVLLYENNTVVVNMLTENSYTFDSPGEKLHHFQIICQKEASKNNKTPFLSFIFVLIMIVLFTLYLKKNK